MQHTIDPHEFRLHAIQDEVVPKRASLNPGPISGRRRNKFGIPFKAMKLALQLLKKTEGPLRVVPSDVITDHP